MGKTAAVVGGVLGVGVPVIANSMARTWLFRKPWLHVIFGCAGAYVVHTMDLVLDHANEHRARNINVMQDLWKEDQQVSQLREERLRQADAIIARDHLDITGAKAKAHH